MTSAKEMGKALTELLGRKVESPYNLPEVVEKFEEALRAGSVLRSYAESADIGLNLHFCDIGADMLKKAYNKLCDKFPELKKRVGEKFEF